jgi:hypothetical protein
LRPSTSTNRISPAGSSPSAQTLTFSLNRSFPVVLVVT